MWTCERGAWYRRRPLTILGYRCSPILFPSGPVDGCVVSFKCNLTELNKGCDVKNMARLLFGFALAAFLAAFTAPLSTTSAFASCPSFNPHCTSGAPGPIAAAGLPFLAVGYGVYWMLRRRRKTD